MSSNAVSFDFVLSSGVSNLIRGDFVSNIKICEMRNNESNVNLKNLWHWFESVNYFFEKTMPVNPRNNTIEITLSCRNTLTDLYPIRYCGLKAL